MRGGSVGEVAGMAWDATAGKIFGTRSENDAARKAAEDKAANDKAIQDEKDRQAKEDADKAAIATRGAQRNQQRNRATGSGYKAAPQDTILSSPIGSSPSNRKTLLGL